MMQKADKVKLVIDTLEHHFPETPIPLDHKDPYTLLIAVLLSAQSTDAGVNKVTPILFERADNPYDMVKLTVEEIRSIIRPVGLSPAKSKNIHALSQILIDQYQGIVPKSLEDLESLPGVGHKTASVVVSQAFGVPAFPVDTHIPALDVPMDAVFRKECRPNGTRCQTAFPKRTLEQTSPTNHLLWPCLLPRSRARSQRMSLVFKNWA